MQPLRDFRRPLAAALHGGKLLVADAARLERGREHVCSRHRVLHGEVHADATDGRHGVRGVADAEEARLPPALQAVDLDCQQLNVVETGNRSSARGFEGQELADRRAERLEATPAHGLVAAFGDDEGALPVVAPVQHDEEMSRLEARLSLVSIVGGPGQAEPQHVHRRADVLELEAAVIAQFRVAPVGGNDEVGAHLERGLCGLASHALDAAALLDQRLCLGLHQQLVGGKSLRLVDHEIEKVPLRHHGDVGRLHGQMGQVGNADALRAEAAHHGLHLLVREAKEIIEKSQLVHDLHGRGVDGVAAEVTQEVGVLFEHDGLHARAREEIAEHQSGRPAAGDAALRCNGHRCQHTLPSSRFIDAIRTQSSPVRYFTDGKRSPFNPCN